jgi:hypothetical protein
MLAFPGNRLTCSGKAGAFDIASVRWSPLASFLDCIVVSVSSTAGNVRAPILIDAFFGNKPS